MIISALVHAAKNGMALLYAPAAVLLLLLLLWARPSSLRLLVACVWLLSVVLELLVTTWAARSRKQAVAA
jgi:hypothetical protein